MYYIISLQPQMNKIEMCAVEYLYRTRDCDFAREVIKSSNKELSGVAHAVIKTIFLKHQNGCTYHRVPEVMMTDESFSDILFCVRSN